MTWRRTDAAIFARDGKSFLNAIASGGKVAIYRQLWKDGKVIGTPQVALEFPLSLEYTSGCDPHVVVGNGSVDQLCQNWILVDLPPPFISLPSDEACAGCCGAGARYSSGTSTVGRLYFGPIMQPASTTSTAKIPKSAVFFIIQSPRLGASAGASGNAFRFSTPENFSTT